MNKKLIMAKADVYFEIENITLGKEKIILTENMTRAREVDEPSRLFIHSHCLAALFICLFAF